MFGLALAFLVLLATLIVVTVDMTRVDILHAATDETGPLQEFLDAAMVARWLVVAVLALWPCFAFELIAKFLLRHPAVPFWKNHRVDIAAVLCPPLRLAMPCQEMNGRLWLPQLGWRSPGKSLHRQLERTFSTPMLIIALLILPVLLIEFGFQSSVERHPWLRFGLHFCTGLIWFAFAFEFLVMINATPKRWKYARQNWIDLAIILLPLVSFLRSLRIVRAVKLAKFAKVQQLARISRIYRMRALLAKTLRALLLFEIAHRILRITPEKKLEKLLEQLAEKEDELNEIREQIQSLTEQIQLKAAVKDEEGPDEEGSDSSPSAA